ncbi:MAG: hypothetical protein EON88_35040 [Brevundimonas sp.]|nr:MAG: hypothetical protein EON88_35040 [Brevundimonas sp.]
MSETRPLLVVGHPGHELYLHGWMEAETPTVCVLTDGSGHRNPSRVDFSRDCVERAGGTVGSLFGQRSDRDWYASLMEGDPRPFVAAAGKLLAEIRDGRSRLVISDARDGYNPMHDAAFHLTALAVEAARRQGMAVDHLVSPAVGTPPHEPMMIHALDDAAVARKEAAFQRYTPLRDEIRHVRAGGALRMEREAAYPIYDAVRPGDIPEYEQYGAERVRAGAYARSLEYARDYRAVLDATRRAVLATVDA